MKTLLILLFASVSIPFWSSGQVITFQKNYNVADYNSSDSGYFLTTDGDNIVMGSGTLCEFGVNKLGCTGLIKTDENGEVIRKKLYDTFPYFTAGGEIKPIPGGGYLLCGSANSANGYRPFLMKLDENGDSLWVRYYDDEDKNYGHQFQILDNGKILLLGAGSLAQSHQHAFIMQTDENGEKEWDTIINIDSPFYGGGEFSTLPDGNLVFGYKKFPLQSFENTLGMTKTDSVGNVLWTKTYQTNDPDYCDVRMKPLANGGFVLSYCTPNWQIGQLQMNLFGIDSMGGFKWNYTFDHIPARFIYGINTTSNGDIIGCGIRKEDNGDYGWLFRVTQEGELLWQRAYRPDTPIPGYVLSELNKLTETPDGGIAAIGTMIDSFPTGGAGVDVWLLKVDADGCLTPGCTEEVITATVEKEGGILKSERQVFFRLSPNPVNTEAKIEFFNPVREGASVRIFNAQGQQVRQYQPVSGSMELKMDFSRLPSGLYSVSFEKDGRIFQSEKIIVTR